MPIAVERTKENLCGAQACATYASAWVLLDQTHIHDYDVGGRFNSVGR